MGPQMIIMASFQTLRGALQEEEEVQGKGESQDFLEIFPMLMILSGMDIEEVVAAATEVKIGGRARVGTQEAVAVEVIG